MLADRLHQTPKQIREGFTYAEFIHFLALLEEESEASEAALPPV